MTEVAPVTGIQRQLWLADRLAPPAAYTVAMSWALQGTLDRDALRRAVHELWRRHPALRTTLREVDGELRQVIAPPDARGADVDFTDVPDQAALADARDAWGQLPLDLENGPIARVRVVSVDGADHELQLAIHHALCDEASLAIWIRDLFALLGRAEPEGGGELPAIASSLAELAARQQQPAHVAAVEEALDFWADHLSGAPQVTELPRRVAADDGPQIGHLYEKLPESVTRATAVLRQQGYTTFQVVAAALGLVLGRYSGQEDLVIGTPVSGRGDPDVADVMGMFASTTVLRLRPALDASTADYLTAARDAVLDAMDFAVASFEQVVDRVRPERTGRTPLFQVMLAYNSEVEVSGSDELTATPVYIPPARARFELTVFVIERADGSLLIRGDYQRDQLEDSLAVALIQALGRAVELLSGPLERSLGELLWSDETELAALTTRTIETAPDYLRGPDILQRIRTAAAERADHVAVIDPDGERHTYGQLLAHADRITGRLHDVGIAAGDVVATARPDGAAAIAAMLGTMAAGAVWAPLDPRSPKAHQTRLLELAGARASLADDGDVVPASGYHAGGLPPDAAGYLYFTSGSTGEPKPVLVDIPALQNLTLGFIDRHQFDESDVLLALPPLTFDAALGDVVPILAVGGTLLLHPDPAALSGPELFEFCRRHGVTSVDAPCALWQQWCIDLDAHPAPAPPSLRRMMIGGEAVPRIHVEAWQRATGGRVPLFNHYGPTETTVCATVHEVGDVLDAHDFGEQGLSIGRSLPNVACYLLDRVGRPVPDGVVGELVIGGAGVARGYLADTSHATPFVPDPFGAALPGSRGVMYHTGDFAVRGPSGLLHFVGRRDLQVKILGRRIELGEIESVVAGHPDVAMCAVTAPIDPSGRRRLVAHLAPRSQTEVDGSELGARVRQYLADRLPKHLIPVSYVVTAKLPVTDRGKVDRSALPEPDPSALRAVGYVAPRTPVEENLAEVWSDELGGVTVGRADTFEEVGGSSLSAARVSGRIHAAHGIRIGLRDLLGDRSLESIAAEIERAATDASAAETDRVDAAAAAGTERAVDTASESVARADLRLLDSVLETPPAAPQSGRSDRPRRILLTGATGFLGAHLLHSLVEQRAGEVHALVRAENPDAAARRVASQCQRMRLPDLPPQVSFGVGDMAAGEHEPGSVPWAELLEHFDTIVNVGGLISIDSDYAGHRGPNVIGPARLLAEAVRTGREVHHVSTLGVFWSAPYARAQVSESDSPAVGFPFGGYNQSKWVSDLLAVGAADRGLSLTVHRPARLTTAWGTGATPAGTWWSGMLSACRELRLVPDLAFREDLLPIDWVADAMARLILSDERPPVVHYWTGDTVPYSTIADVLAERDSGVRLVDYSQWHAQLMRHVAQGGAPLFAPFVGNLAAPGTPRRQVPDFDATASLDMLTRLGAEGVPPAVDLLRREIDVLPVPTGGLQ